MFNIYNFLEYAPRCLKIQTKIDGLRPFKLRKIQLKYIQHLKDDFPDGIIRSISLKARQTGWSTVIAGINTHRMATTESYRGIVLADKFTRTQAIHGIYTTLIDNLPLQVRPMIAKRNESEILFDNPDVNARAIYPGLGSGYIAETGRDKDSGKSSARSWGHISEYAFLPYAMELDQSIQNSIPLSKGTAIFKESTANGMAGDGEAFFEQWQAAERGDTIYKPFFVSWYDVDDYQAIVPRGFIPTKEEKELLLRCPDISQANLSWRRMKLMEMHTSSESGLSPSELFCQDFPSFSQEAFLSTGRPVFDTTKLKIDIEKLRTSPTPLIKIKIEKPFLSMYPDLLKIFEVPMKGKKYFIGADVAEGLESGDSSSAKIIDSDMNEVGLFHGKIDPDHLGEVLVELAKIYNDALLVPEKNNMGNTTLQAIKRAGYLRVWMRAIDDELEDSRETSKMGWVTTAKSKDQMLNLLISSYRDGDVLIKDIDVLKEMLRLVRNSDGTVDLGGRDRIVGLCLAIMGTRQSYEPAIVFNPEKKNKMIFETKDNSRDYATRKVEHWL